MPQVTAIEPQKKKPGRFNIFLDDKFAFAIDEINLAQSHLKPGQVLTGEQVTTFIVKNRSGQLLDYSLRFLSYRPRSEKEVVDYLAKKISKFENIKFQQAKESPQIQIITKKLKKYNYLDDRQFAKWLVRSRARSQPRGVAHLRAELRMKGIDRDIIENILENAVDERKLALASLAKLVKKWPKLKGLELKKKVYQYLASRGFSYETIKEVFAKLQQKG